MINYIEKLIKDQLYVGYVTYSSEANELQLAQNQEEAYEAGGIFFELVLDLEDMKELQELLAELNIPGEVE